MPESSGDATGTYAAVQPSVTSKPRLNPRFIYTSKFRSKLGKVTEVHDLTADGHIDYAHKIGIDRLVSTLISHERIVTDGEITWYATVRVEVQLKNGMCASGLSCCTSRDQRVTQQGFEVAVAETRALKRAIGVACNITEEMISNAFMAQSVEPTRPTREFVEEPLDETEIPEHLIKPFEHLNRDTEGDQFKV